MAPLDDESPAPLPSLDLHVRGISAEKGRAVPFTLLTNADILTIDAQDNVYLGGWLAVEDGRIAGIGPAGTVPTGQGDARLDLTGHILLPGLVNAHTHSPMILFRGHAEGHSLLTMHGWRTAIRDPELALDASDIGPATALSCAEMALSGTTTFADQYFFADEVAEATIASGLRSVLTYGIVELGDAARGRAELQTAIGFVERLRDSGGRVTAWLGPHAPYVDNSEELLLAEAAAAQRLGIGMHLHMAVGPEDNEHTMAVRGVTAAVALAQIGFLDARVLVAHCLDLSLEDIAAFAGAPATAVAYCATAGLRSGRPYTCPAVALRQAGVTVALGTDNVASNNSYDMFAEMKIAGLAASHREGRAGALPPGTLLRMATGEGAGALGLTEQIGSLEVGKRADLIAVDARGPGYAGAPDLAALLVYSGSGRDVRHVMVDGEWVVRDGALQRQDAGQLREEFAQVYARFWARARSRQAES